jgi:hypothetical protein
MATLTHKEQPFTGTVRIRGIAAPGARLAGVVRIHLHRHATRKPCFVGDVAVQLSKGPLGGMPIALALFHRNTNEAFSVLLALMGTPDASFADVCQVLHANDAVWVLVYDVPTDEMVSILFQPSLSSTDDDKPSSRGTSAFLLQPFSQSRIDDLFHRTHIPNITQSVNMLSCVNRQSPLKPPSKERRIPPHG